MSRYKENLDAISSQFKKMEEAEKAKAVAIQREQRDQARQQREAHEIARRYQAAFEASGVIEYFNELAKLPALRISDEPYYERINNVPSMALFYLTLGVLGGDLTKDVKVKNHTPARVERPNGCVAVLYFKGEHTEERNSVGEYGQPVTESVRVGNSIYACICTDWRIYVAGTPVDNNLGIVVQNAIIAEKNRP